MIQAAMEAHSENWNGFTPTAMCVNSQHCATQNWLFSHARTQNRIIHCSYLHRVVVWTNLIPTPSHRLVIAVCKNRGEGLVRFTTWMTSVSIEERGVPCWKNEWSCTFCPTRWSFKHLWSENVPLLVQNEERVHKMCPFDQENLPPPPSVY